MPVCAFAHCKEKNNLHFLPKSKELRDKWLEQINRVNYTPTVNTRICISHFDENSFESKVDQRGKKRKILKDFACPTLNLKKDEKSNDTTIKKQRKFRTFLKNYKEETSMEEFNFQKQDTYNKVLSVFTDEMPVNDNLVKSEPEEGIREKMYDVDKPHYSQMTIEDKLNNRVQYPNYDWHSKHANEDITEQIDKFNDPLGLNDDHYFNPWAVENAEVFLKYCCPECDFSILNLELFAHHALENHTNAATLFGDEIHIEKPLIQGR